MAARLLQQLQQQLGLVRSPWLRSMEERPVVPDHVDVLLPGRVGVMAGMQHHAGTGLHAPAQGCLAWSIDAVYAPLRSVSELLARSCAVGGEAQAQE